MCAVGFGGASQVVRCSRNACTSFDCTAILCRSAVLTCSNFTGADGASSTFDAWLDETVKAPPAEREARFAAWDKAPGARACHPREEHLIPLMVIAGAAGDSAGTHAFRDVIGGKTISAFEFR